MRKLLFLILFSSLTAYAGNDQGGGTYTVCGVPLVSFLKKAEHFDGYREFYEITQNIGRTYPTFQVKLLKIRDVFWYEIPCDTNANGGSSLPFDVDQPVTFWNNLVFVFKKKFDLLPNKAFAILNESLRRICQSRENYHYRDAKTSEAKQNESDRCTLQYTSAVIAFSRGDITEKQFEKSIDLFWIHGQTRHKIQSLIDYWLDASLVAIEVSNKAIGFCNGEMSEDEFISYYTSQLPFLAPEYNLSPYSSPNYGSFNWIFHQQNMINLYSQLPVCDSINSERVLNFQKHINEFNKKLSVESLVDVSFSLTRDGLVFFPYIVRYWFNFNF